MSVMLSTRARDSGFGARGSASSGVSVLSSSVAR